MSSVWVVEHGEYDDYEVAALYSNEAAAKKHCDQMNLHHDQGYRYNEWGIEDECPEIHWVWTLSNMASMSRQPKEPYASYTSDKHEPVQVYTFPNGYISVAGSDKDAVQRRFDEETTDAK